MGFVIHSVFELVLVSVSPKPFGIVLASCLRAHWIPLRLPIFFVQWEPAVPEEQARPPAAAVTKRPRPAAAGTAAASPTETGRSTRSPQWARSQGSVTGNPGELSRRIKCDFLTQPCRVKRGQTSLDFVQLLGEGAYGQAFKAMERSTGKPWCVKEIQKLSKDREPLSKEVRSRMSGKVIKLVVIALPWGLDACALPRTCDISEHADGERRGPVWC